jgi:hypothetical protein
MSKYIKIPSAVKMVNIGTKKATGVELSFRSFICDDLSSHPLWGVSLTETRAFKDVLDALDEAEEGDDGVLKLSGTVYQFLRQAVEKPEYVTISANNGQQGSMRGWRRWNGAGIVQLLPFIDAILNAEDKAPTVEAKQNGAAVLPAKEVPASDEASA